MSVGKQWSHEDLEACDTVMRYGRVTSVRGRTIRARVPEVGVGELCEIQPRSGEPLFAEVVGFDEAEIILMPLGAISCIDPNCRVSVSKECRTVPCGPAVTGRVLDAMGRPIDGLGTIDQSNIAPIIAAPPDPLTREPISEPLATGIRAIDGLLTVGRGQRTGIFAAAGVGKSTLLAMLARFVKADSVVVALIGERGREVRPFIKQNLGSKSVVVVSTSDQPALMRVKAAYTATAIAEANRRRGEHVVLLMDSVTRFARALREVGLAAGEPPGRQGYPPSVFATLPQLFERAGADDKGSITAFYTVLVAGDDLEEPVADETLSLLDGHVILSRRLAARGQFPAIDIPSSASRLMKGLVSAKHRSAAMQAKEILSLYEENHDKIICGAYEPGFDRNLDRAVQAYPTLIPYLRQDDQTNEPMESTVRKLESLIESFSQ